MKSIITRLTTYMDNGVVLARDFFTPVDMKWLIAMAGLLVFIFILLMLRRRRRLGEDIGEIPADKEKQIEIEVAPGDDTLETPQVTDGVEAVVTPEPVSDTIKKESPDERPEPAPGPDTAEKELAEEKAGPISFFQRLKNGMAKTRDNLSGRLDQIVSGNRKLDDDLLEEIEELLITSDIGVSTSMDIIERLAKKSSDISADTLKQTLKDELLSIMEAYQPETETVSASPHVIMVVGVNGVGKTTTIGKLAARYTGQGKKVLIAAADTFRAAASEQLTIWAERAGADIVKHKSNSDPAAVAYDSIEAAIARKADVVIVDTAGRLHTKVNLMEELKKIKRTIGKKMPEAPHETLMVLDATTGQNALSQAKLFNEGIEVTGTALTKLDGTAKGGIVISICSTLNIPLKYIGVGEQIDDLQDFDSVTFVDALF